MRFIWLSAVGKSGAAAIGLKLFGGLHWKPAMKRVSPEAPARPFASPPPVLLPVWAVPQPAALTPMTVPPTARPVNVRNRRRLGFQDRQSAPLSAISDDGPWSCVSFILPFPRGAVDERCPSLPECSVFGWTVAGNLTAAGTAPIV